MNFRDYPVIFKIESNAPSRYSIKPCIGTISRQSSAGVRINLTGKQKSHGKSVHQKDQILVQVARLPENFNVSPFSNPSQFEKIWASISKFQTIQCEKLKANFFPQKSFCERNANEEKIQELEKKVEELLAENHIWENRYNEMVGIQKEPERVPKRIYPPLSEDPDLKVEIIPAGADERSASDVIFDFIGGLLCEFFVASFECFLELICTALFE